MPSDLGAQGAVAQEALGPGQLDTTGVMVRFVPPRWVHMLAVSGV